MTTNANDRYMEFRLTDQLFAIPLHNVKEVISKPAVTLTPNMPTYCEGIINLRGQILSVFNLRKKMAIDTKSQSTNSNEVVIVIEEEGVIVGAVVDEVTRVLQPEASTIGPAPLNSVDPAKKYLSHVIRLNTDLILVIKIGNLLEIDKYHRNIAAA